MKWFMRHWYDVAGIFVIPAALWAWLGHWSVAQLILLLNFVVILIHQFEEYRFPGGEPWILNEVFQPKGGPVDRYPLNQLNAAFMNTTAWLFYLVPVFFPNQVWLGLAPVIAGMVGQLVVHGVLTNFKLKTFYNPGLAAVVFGHVTLGIWYVVEVYRQRLIHWWDWPAGVVYMVVFLLVTFRLLGYGLLCRRDSKHPFAAAEMNRWSRVRRLRRAGITPGEFSAVTNPTKPD